MKFYKLAIKEDGDKIRVIEAYISKVQESSFYYGTVFRYTVKLKEDICHMRELQMIFVDDQENKDIAKELISKYIKQLIKRHDDPNYLGDVRERIVDKMKDNQNIIKEYIGVDIPNFASKITLDGNLKYPFDSIGIELIPDNNEELGYRVIKHTKSDTISKFVNKQASLIEEWKNTSFWSQNNIDDKIILKRGKKSLSKSEKEESIDELMINFYVAVKKNGDIYSIFFGYLLYFKTSNKVVLSNIIIFDIDIDSKNKSWKIKHLFTITINSVLPDKNTFSIVDDYMLSRINDPFYSSPDCMDILIKRDHEKDPDGLETIKKITGMKKMPNLGSLMKKTFIPEDFIQKPWPFPDDGIGRGLIEITIYEENYGVKVYNKDNIDESTFAKKHN